ncbi:Cytosolic phospholipase A2 gamma [Collichthys lucidus]|uniref:Cytosolic phospholipase A2 gamma n=1 Tax=Collichthys lucidus TaxID=240159 RepID=A0A4U5VWE3_COLLU|nr:Cytosolic phospholipase A2 gamma [Collichthys lucidus]
MEGNSAAPEKAIRQSQSLCAGEQKYVHKRKQIVLEALQNLGANCTANNVPHIALLGSGGGQRAAVGLIGTLYQMEKEGLLDTLLYLGGVSGSTWSMSMLYNDPEWSSNMDRAVSRLSGPGVELEQMDLRNLSDEADRNASNPYPIYNAIEKDCFTNGPIEGKWFELSPHEAGFTELGFFIETSLLGSKFKGGELVEKKPEMDMVKLQVLGHIDDAAEEYLRVHTVLEKLVALTRSTVKNPTALTDLDTLQNVLEVTKANHTEALWLEAKSPEERKGLAKQWSLEMLAAVETWTQSQQKGGFKTHVFLLIQKILPLIWHWEWGTTENYLYQHQDPTIPPCLHTKDRFHLIDAGMVVNVPYPVFLGDKRDIDLMIAPEYSAGNMFETLTLARDYAAEVKKPFPEIDDKILEERDWPKDCYVFEGKEKEPTIIFMPFFNRRNCKDAEEVKAKMEEFSTFQRPFSQEKIEFLLETAKANVKNNKETLLREINKVVLRRKERL